MIPYREALEILEKVAASYPGSTESVPLAKALGRILAEPVQSSEEVPSFTNSAMDGFAVFSSDTHGATAIEPVRLPVRGAIVAAGDIEAFRQARAQSAGCAVEIMTGAPVPEGGYDAVVRVEDVRVIRSERGQVDSIELAKPVRAGENVRLKGTDFAIGQRVLSPGVRIAPEHVMACASLGVAHLKVKRSPRVAIVSTGAELVSSEAKTLEPGMIRNSTGPFLVAAFSQLGIEASYFGVVRDEPGRYRDVIEKAILDGHDLIVSTGAVSMGKFDFVSSVLKDMGATIRFHKAAIRPGKPILFAEVPHRSGKAAFFGVPGNPVSTAVGLRFFVEPFIRSVWGLEREEATTARLNRDFPKPDGLRCFFKGKAQMTPGGLEVEALKGQASYVVSALVDANCWVVFSEAGSHVRAGSNVEVVPLHHSFEKGVLS